MGIGIINLTYNKEAYISFKRTLSGRCTADHKENYNLSSVSHATSRGHMVSLARRAEWKQSRAMRGSSVCMCMSEHLTSIL